MSDPRVIKLADLLVSYCLAVEQGETVLIRGNAHGFPLVKEAYRAVVRAGGHPFVYWEDDEFREILLKEGSDDQIQHVDTPLTLLYETYDCMIACRADNNTRILSSIDPSRQQLLAQGRRDLTQTYMDRSARGDLRWVVTRYPTAAYAQDADMSLADYEDFVYGACFVDREDPVAAWGQLSRRQQHLVNWLDGKNEVRVVGPNADLRLSIAGRQFINSDGRANMPSGEIFTGPVESSVEGWVRFTYPAIYQSREVDGVALTFKEGRVVDATATKNEPFLHSVLDTDAGARYLGEFAVGTNEGIQQFTRSILFDEKIGGTIHMALGSSYPQTGGQNRSAVHWDMICDMRDGSQIWVDDELFYENGRFMVT